MLVEIHKKTSHQKSSTWMDYDIFVHVTPPGFSMHWNMEWKRFMVDRGMNRFYDMLMKFFPELNIGINFTNKPGYSLPWKDEGRYISEVMQFLLMIFQKQLPCQPYHIA